MKKLLIIIGIIILPFSTYAMENNQDNGIITIVTNKIQSMINKKGEEYRIKFVATIENFKNQAKDRINERVQNILNSVLGNIQKPSSGTLQAYINTGIGNIQKSIEENKQITTIDNKKSIQQQVLEAVNNERKKLNIESLSLQEQLNNAAQKYADDMNKTKVFSHTSKSGSTVMTRVSDEKYIWKSVGENLGMGTESIEQVMDMRMKSPGHKANILNKDFKELGVGYTEGYRVQVFGKR